MLKKARVVKIVIMVAAVMEEVVVKREGLEIKKSMVMMLVMMAVVVAEGRPGNCIVVVRSQRPLSCKLLPVLMVGPVRGT